MPDQPNPPADRPTTPLSLYCGDEPNGDPLGDASPGQSPPAATAPIGPTSELSELLDAWQVATKRLEMTHAQLRDEVGRLRAELEHKNRELERKDRLADLGEMASHVAHEVRNSLTPLTLYLSLLRRRLASDLAGLELLGKAESGFTSLESTVNDLLAFSASRSPQTSDFLIRGLIDDLAASLEGQLEAQRVELEIDAPDAMTVHADREMIRRAVLNLMLNAIDAMPDGGELVVTACYGEDGVEIEVADSGPGLEGINRDRLFEPFYSTKESGTGLGLSVVAHAAEAHGGTVVADDCPEGGAAFTLHLPPPMAREAAA